jgi:hypothetical protein
MQPCAVTGQAGALGQPKAELTAALKLFGLAAASFAVVAADVASSSSSSSCSGSGSGSSSSSGSRSSISSSGSGGSSSGETIPQMSLAELMAQAIIHLDARTSRVIAVAPAAAPDLETVVPAGVPTSQDSVRYFQEAVRHSIDSSCACVMV